MDRDASLLCVCANDAEHALFTSLGFTDVTISNLDDRLTNAEERFSPYAWSFQDAQNLSFEDQQFDFAFVADGLHHCSSPHRALLEMYRVARRGIIVVESRDNALMRLANRVGFSPTYELEAVAVHSLTHGGVDNTPIPNHIYRWTEREFEKTVQSFDPKGRHTFRYFYGLNLPHFHASVRRNPLKGILVKAVAPAAWLFTKLAKRQCNTFMMVALRPQTLWPWLQAVGDDGEHVELDREYVTARFNTGAGTPDCPASDEAVEPSPSVALD